MEEILELIVFPVTTKQYNILASRINNIRRNFELVDGKLKSYVAAQLILDNFWGDSALVTAGYVSKNCVSIYNTARKIDSILKEFHKNKSIGNVPHHDEVEKAMNNRTGVPLEFKTVFEVETAEELVELATIIDDMFEECSKVGYDILYLTNTIMLANALVLHDMKIKGEKQEQIDRDFQLAQTLRIRNDFGDEDGEFDDALLNIDLNGGEIYNEDIPVVEDSEESLSREEVEINNEIAWLFEEAEEFLRLVQQYNFPLEGTYIAPSNEAMYRLYYYTSFNNVEEWLRDYHTQTNIFSSNEEILILDSGRIVRSNNNWETIDGITIVSLNQTSNLSVIVIDGTWDDDIGIFPINIELSEESSE